MRLIFITLFGLESMVKQELLTLGFEAENLAVKNGMVFYQPADWQMCSLERYLAKANLYLGACERVYLELWQQENVCDFDSYFAAIKQIPWEKWHLEQLPIVVDAYSLDSSLASVPALQRLAKKAIVSRLQAAYKLAPTATLPEAALQKSLEVQIVLKEDVLSVRLDSSAHPLHKRGYRKLTSLAPLKETLAYGILQLLHWPQHGGAAAARARYMAAYAQLAEADSAAKFAGIEATTTESIKKEAVSATNITMPVAAPSANWQYAALEAAFASEYLEQTESLLDIFAGSGTFAIEGAMRALCLAPGLELDFGFTAWRPFVQQRYLQAEKALARQLHEAALAKQGQRKLPIYAADIAPDILAKARQNAATFNLAPYLTFQVADARDFKLAALAQTDYLANKKYLLLSNLPYGERLANKQAVMQLLAALRSECFQLDGSLQPQLRCSFIHIADGTFQAIGYNADKQRKLYNGNIVCYLYQFFKGGPRKLTTAPSKPKEHPFTAKQAKLGSTYRPNFAPIRRIKKPVPKRSSANGKTE